MFVIKPYYFDVDTKFEKSLDESEKITLIEWDILRDIKYTSWKEIYDSVPVKELLKGLKSYSSNIISILTLESLFDGPKEPIFLDELALLFCFPIFKDDIIWNRGKTDFISFWDDEYTEKRPFDDHISEKLTIELDKEEWVSLLESMEQPDPDAIQVIMNAKNKFGEVNFFQKIIRFPTEESSSDEI